MRVRVQCALVIRVHLVVERNGQRAVGVDWRVDGAATDQHGTEKDEHRLRQKARVLQKTAEVVVLEVLPRGDVARLLEETHHPVAHQLVLLVEEALCAEGGGIGASCLVRLYPRRDSRLSVLKFRGRAVLDFVCRAHARRNDVAMENATGLLRYSGLSRRHGFAFGAFFFFYYYTKGSLRACAFFVLCDSEGVRWFDRENKGREGKRVELRGSEPTTVRKLKPKRKKNEICDVKHEDAFTLLFNC